MNHIWRPLVEKAGYSIEDLPKTWDAYYDFFKDVQKKLRAQGMRNLYGLGFQLNTTGNDSNARFNEGVLHRLARGDVVPGDLLPIRPGQDCGRGQLGAIVRDDDAGATAHGWPQWPKFSGWPRT